MILGLLRSLHIFVLSRQTCNTLAEHSLVIAMNEPRTNHLYLDHALIIAVPGVDARARSTLRSVYDEIGTWFATADALDALELIQQLAGELPKAKVLAAASPCLLGPERFVGPAVSAISREWPSAPSGAVILDTHLHDAIAAYVEDPADFVELPHRRGSTWLAFVPWCSIDEIIPRSNITSRPEELFGRAELLRRLDDAASHPRPIELTGSAGTGKSALVMSWLYAQMQRDDELGGWRIDLDGVTELTEIGARIAHTFNLKLGADPTDWSDQLDNALSHTSPRAVIVFDGADALSADADAWLGALLTNAPSEERVWIVTRRTRDEDATIYTNIHINRLDEASAIAYLCSPTGPGKPARSLAAARALAAASAGHPASLRLARFRLGADLEQRTGPSDPLGLQASWNDLSPIARDVLALLVITRTNTSHEALISMLSRRFEEDAIAAQIHNLNARGWLQEDATATSTGWSLPGLLREFLEGKLDQETRARASLALLDQIDAWITAMPTVQGSDALEQLKRHMQSANTVLTWALDTIPERGIKTIARLRNFYRHNIGGFAYTPLLDRARDNAFLPEAPALSIELDLATAIFDDHTPGAGGLDAARARYERCVEELELLDADARFDTLYFYAVHIEDTLTGPEDFERCEGLIKRAIEIIPKENSAYRHASCNDLLARLEVARGNKQAAFAHAQAACEFAEAATSDMLLGFCTFTLHQLLLFDERFEQAALVGERALKAMTRAGYTRGRVMALASTGFMHIRQSSGKEARTALLRALAIAKSCSYLSGIANCESMLGVANLVDLRFEQAHTHFARARRDQREYGFDWNLHQTSSLMAMALSGMGEVDRARELLADARAFFADYPDDEIKLMLEMMSMTPEIHEAGWIDRAPGALAALRARVQDHPAASTPGRGADIGLVMRYLEAAQQNLGEAPEEALRVHEGYGGFALPGSDEFVNISRKRTVKRVFAVLIEHRLEHPGEPLEAHTLVERGWPGETPEVRSGLMRLYVTINTLRNLGLDDILETHGEGYRLSPGVPLEMVPS